MINKRFKTGFSLIELSIVILVIGILISGLVTASALVSKARLKTARTITQSSPVVGIKDLLLWLEPTSEYSFIDSETEDGSYITTWYDINPQSTLKWNASSSGANRPTYKRDCINGLPCVNFTKDNSNYLEFSNPELNLRQTTIFLVLYLKTFNGSCCTSVISTSGSWTSGSLHLIGYSDNTIRYSVHGTSEPRSTDDSFVEKKQNVISIVDDSSDISFYFNGQHNVTESFEDTVKRFGDTRIGAWNSGRFLDAHFGEIIIFKDALNSEKRKAVENYLIKKWKIKNL